jgi:hypothetical protein
MAPQSDSANLFAELSDMELHREILEVRSQIDSLSGSAERDHRSNDPWNRNRYRDSESQYAERLADLSAERERRRYHSMLSAIAHSMADIGQSTRSLFAVGTVQLGRSKINNRNFGPLFGRRLTASRGSSPGHPGPGGTYPPDKSRPGGNKPSRPGWRPHIREHYPVKTGEHRRHIVSYRYFRNFARYLSEAQLRTLGYDADHLGGVEKARRKYVEDLFNNPKNFWRGPGDRNSWLGRMMRYFEPYNWDFPTPTERAEEEARRTRERGEREREERKTERHTDRERQPEHGSRDAEREHGPDHDRNPEREGDRRGDRPHERERGR